MATTTLTNFGDTSISQASPAKNYGGTATLTTRAPGGTAGLAAYSLFRGLPSGEDVVIESAYYELFPVADGATATINLYRVTAPWIISKASWSNQPTTDTGTIVGSYTGTFTKDQPIQIPLASLVQAYSTGSVANYGVRLSTTSSTARIFHSANAPVARLRPRLVISYSVKPSTPTGFVATGGASVSVLRPGIPWVFADRAGGLMTGYQFQVNLTNTWTSPAYDSGIVDSSEPLHMWHEDLPAGTTYWYRVRHRNDAGLLSDWSDGHQLKYTPRPSLTVTAPTGTVNGYTPTTAWATSGTQTRFRVRVRASESGIALADSGWLSGDDTSWAPSRALSVAPGTSLVSVVEIDDDVDRVSTPGSPSTTSATSTTYSIAAASGVTPVTDLVVQPAEFGPAALLTWSRSTSPDSFIVERSVDGAPWRPIEVDLGEAAQGGTSYAWYDTTAPPRAELVYRVRPVDDGSMGAAVTTNPIMLRPLFIWLADPADSSWVLPLAGMDQGTWTLGEDSAVLNVLGSDRSIIIHEGIRGYEGMVSGEFVDGLPTIEGLTARQLRDRARRLRAEPTRLWRLSVGDMNLPVIVRNVQIVPVPGYADRFGVACEFYQQGEVPELGWVA